MDDLREVSVDIKAERQLRPETTGSIETRYFMYQPTSKPKGN